MSEFCDACIDGLRESIGVEHASHPIMAAVLKYDQTLLRCMTLKAMRRQALLGVLFGPAYRPNFQVHPVDAWRADRAARAKVIMRLAVYNEIRKTAKAQKPLQEQPFPATQTQAMKSLLARVLRALSEDNKFSYNGAFFRHWPQFAKLDGWIQFLRLLHHNKMLVQVESVCDGVRQMCPVSPDTEISTITGYRARIAAPNVILNKANLVRALENNLSDFDDKVPGTGPCVEICVA